MAWAADIGRLFPWAGTIPTSPTVSRLSTFRGQSLRPPGLRPLDITQQEAGRADVRCRVLEKAAEPAAGHARDEDAVAVEEGFGPSVAKEADLLSTITSLANGLKERVLSEVSHLVFRDAGFSDNQFTGNWAPVAEIGEKTAAPVVFGAIPTDFPPGVYVRNGPNPQFGGKWMSSPCGILEYHAFEGEGMLHATFFEEGGKAAYLNRYVKTEGYELEKKRGRPVWLTSFQGDPWAIALGFFFNMTRFGKVNKVTCNTSTFKHAGKYFAVAEADMPYEFNLSDLTTLGVWDGCHGQWNRPFTAHPLRDPETNELVIFGFNAFKPHFEIAVWSADGQGIVHRIDLELDHCPFCHEIAITRRYTLMFDFPLNFDVGRLMSGGSLLDFQATGLSRVGILPRYGDSKSTKWFPVEAGYSWHKVNSFEDGDEVVVIGVRSRRAIVPFPPLGDRKEWWARGLQIVDPKHAGDPAIDGVLAGLVYEWRFNMVTGDVSERNLSGYSFSGEYPIINRSYAGVKNKYGYMALSNPEKSKRGGISFTGWVKLILPQSADEELKAEFHHLETCWGVSELSFVARPNPKAEDDGWVVGYAHDEEAGISYLYIIDAQNFSGEPVAKLQLPQRVPYGFHATYFYEKEPEHVLARSKNSPPSRAA